MSALFPLASAKQRGILPAVLLCLVLGSCVQSSPTAPALVDAAAEEAHDWPPFEDGNPWQYLDSLQPCDGFDFPVGIPNGKGYYDAQPFGKNTHLGEDWNAVTGGATDLGDPVHAIGDGRVFFARDVRGGWGNVVRIVHRCPVGDRISLVESLYGHLDTVLVRDGEIVRRGQQIGTIGDAHGLYSPHLHLEVRDTLGLGILGGYSSENDGWMAPKEFMKGRRAKR